MDHLRLYFRYLGVSWRSQLQYRASFILQTLGTLLVSVTEYATVLALFARFHSVGGWTLPEVALFYGAVNVAWALAEGMARGFDDFASLVRSGEFDRILLRPRPTVLQILGREFTLRRVGRFGLGAGVLAWGWLTLDLGADPARLALLLWAIAGAVALFVGLLVIQATIAFWTIESLEVMNVLTYGGVTTAQYPLSIYPGWLRGVFIAAVPLGCAVYFPIVAILGRTDPLGTSSAWQATSPAVCGLFLLLALRFWRFGVARYTSTGS